MKTAIRTINSKCINKNCKRYHGMILAGEPRGLSGLDVFGRENHMCMGCVIESRKK